MNSGLGDSLSCRLSSHIQMYRALEFLAAEDDYIQAQLYANTQKLSKRNDRIHNMTIMNFFL